MSKCAFNSLNERAFDRNALEGGRAGEASVLFATITFERVEVGDGTIEKRGEGWWMKVSWVDDLRLLMQRREEKRSVDGKEGLLERVVIELEEEEEQEDVDDFTVELSSFSCFFITFTSSLSRFSRNAPFFAACM